MTVPRNEEPLVAPPRPLAWATLSFMVALVWFGLRIDRPPGFIFDEQFYWQVGQLYIQGQWVFPSTGGFNPPNREHPPLAKMLFALVMQVRPDPHTAPRFASAVFGAVGAAGAGFLAWRLTRARIALLAAPLLLLLDPMWDLHARIMIMDVFAAAFMVWAFAVAFTDHRWSPYAAGVLGACAAASKYIALVMFPALAVVIYLRAGAYASGPGTDGAGGADGTVGKAPSHAFRTTVVAVAAIPTLVMMLVNLPFWWAIQAKQGAAEATGQILFLIIDGIFLGSEALPSHQQETHPLTWLVLQQPMVYFFDAGTKGDGLFRAVFAYGSPVVWWGALVGAMGFLAVPVKRYAARFRAVQAKRPFADRAQRAWNGLGGEERHRFRTLGAAFAIFLSGFLPFLLLDRATFIYYMVLLLPWFAVMLAIVLDGLWTKAWAAPVLRTQPLRRGVAVAVLVAAFAVAAWMWPVYTAAPMTVDRFSGITELVPWSRWLQPGDLTNV